MKRLPAIPTVYRGIKFRSKLEAKYARAFDILGISWTYEEVNFMFDDGTCYAPDFYMPEIDTFFEVKGVMDEESKRKVEQLAKLGNRVVVGLPDGSIKMANGSSTGVYVCIPVNERKDSDLWTDVYMSVCDKCETFFFYDGIGSYECTACGEHDGDHHLRHVEPFDNLLQAAYRR